ncbi:MAG: hypothetical protein MUC50_12205 [Myxococcota bacterium]|jgi:hypothetical protein|nr:hypothetical protein [Myxococcota bacterium]
MNRRLFTAAMVTGCALLLCLGCEVGEYPEPDSFEDEGADARFSTAKNLGDSLLRQIDLAATLQNTTSISYPFCIYTVRVSQNTQTENNVLSWATTAMNTWIAPLAGQPGWRVTRAQAYRVQRTSSGCPRSHNGLRVYTVEISDMQGANNQMPGFLMHMGGWGIAYLAFLHEMGHGIGMGDGYSYADGSHTPIGQPSSTMKDCWDHNGVLQPDDIDGIRFLWARIRGASNPCPSGYVLGGCQGSGCSWAVYCVRDTNPPKDNCPNDPKKTEPGLCGCGVPEGTCGTCTNSNSNCASWAAAGECTKNPNYMLTSCCAACKTTSTALAAKDFVGYYERTPVLNNWHKVNITLVNNALRWKNADGVSWSLTFASGVLKAGSDCPYGAQTISVEKKAGTNTITGLRFNGELYLRR